jgi:hypothetical protein
MNTLTNVIQLVSSCLGVAEFASPHLITVRRLKVLKTFQSLT